MTDEVKVDERMSRHVVSVSAADTLDHAAQTMVERGVGSALVVMSGEKLEGIITERDVLEAVARGLVPWSTKVAECMTADPMTVGPNTTRQSALKTMFEGGFRHLPVKDDERLVGIVSLRDLAPDEAPE